MTPVLPISVCIIAGEEAHRIGETLDGLSDWVEEIIVVVNEGAKDGTERIAANHGAKTFLEPWKGHIDQKNSAAQKASFEWILSLDADEIVSKELKNEILKLFSSGNISFDAYSFPRCTMYCEKWIRHGDWYPDRQTRLWRKGTAHWGGTNPHDRLIPENTVGYLKSDLLHKSMESTDHQVQKYLFYAKIFAAEREKAGKRAKLTDLIFRPFLRFIRGYFLRLGFLDGWRGYVIAQMAAYYTFLRYLKAYLSQNDLT